MAEKVSIRRCTDYDPSMVKSMLLKSIDDIGFNLNSLSGKKVLLKPNLLAPSLPEKQVTTHPVFVRAAVEIVLDAGGKVSIGDAPGLGNLNRCLKTCGILDALQGLPVTWADFSTAEMIKTSHAPVRELAMVKVAFESDIIINLPKLKSHTQMYMTCAVKNMFGLMPGLAKGKMHLVSGTDNLDFAKMLVEYCYFRKPDLSLVDGIMAMDGNGPGSGDPFPLHLILAGQDPMAVDVVASKIVNFDETDILTFSASGLLGLGVAQIDQIRTAGETIESLVRKDFRPAARGRGFARVPAFISGPLKESMAIKPVWEHSRCTVCQECIKICPADALQVVNRRITVNKKKCIRCFCCQEICPEKAISARRNLAGRVIEKILR